MPAAGNEPFAVLIDAAARRPEDSALWLARLMTKRGLQAGLAEIHRRYARLVAAEPHDLAGQGQYLCPKWYGSWELAHAWAWEAMQAAPPGAMQGALVADRVLAAVLITMLVAAAVAGHMVVSRRRRRPSMV